MINARAQMFLKEFRNLSQPSLKTVFDEYPEKVKSAFNTLWGFIGQFVMQPSQVSEELEKRIRENDFYNAISEALYSPSVMTIIVGQ